MDTHTHKKRQKMKPDVAAQLNPVGEWIISQSWAKKINFFSRTLGCFRIHATFKTKPWDIYWQLQELSSLMFPLISSSCSKWRCGSGCHCSIVWCEIFSFSTNAGFFFWDWRTWFSRDAFLMIWRRQLSPRKDEMNIEGGVSWQHLNGCFLPPSGPGSSPGLL